jgi:septal ring factor EnvC (AmiA/AmiB activator)
LDHGSSYLSVYGSNESVFKAVGQSIRAGEVIAAVGNSGGSAETGLYFELRHQGQPLDPMKWVNLR